MDLRYCLLFAAALVASDSGASNVYRCDDGGRMHFSDKPCVAGQVPLAVALPNTMETSAGDEALARDYDRRITDRRKPRATKADAKSGKAVAREGGSPDKKPRAARSRGAKRTVKSPATPKSRDTEPAYITTPGAKPAK